MFPLFWIHTFNGVLSVLLYGESVLITPCIGLGKVIPTFFQLLEEALTLNLNE